MSGEYEYAQEQARLRHQSVRQVSRWFDYRHLGAGAPRDVSAKVAGLAGDIIALIPADDPELTAGLRKLLEAKDCFVRAAIAAQTGAGA